MRVSHPRQQAYPGDPHAKAPDPILYAWRKCNPGKPFPPQLGTKQAVVYMEDAFQKNADAMRAIAPNVHNFS